ncbi:hypothetical protein A4G20_02665 [Pasteurellaceae bacterium RH1A]|nr:hypothetical protein A4G20_02665 [Pasteurellaceae bacterium RH1A]
MNPIPALIQDFLHKHHVVSLATYANHQVWAASCFYVFDEANQRLLIMTAKKTLHAQNMLANPEIAGTIAGQPKKFGEIAGLQFSALAECLEEPTARQAALDLYSAKHPIAKLAKFASTEIWALHLTKLKHTENKTVFSQKTVWERS